MKATTRSLARVGSLGALGGAINAWLCYVQFPVPAAEATEFSWTIIPAGTAHGAILALAAARGLWLAHRPPMMRITVAIGLSWLAGWLSHVPIQLYVDTAGTHEAFSLASLLKAFWPFDSVTRTLWLPFYAFGLVTLMYLLLLGFYRRADQDRPGTHLFIGVAAGVLGSLWWWITWKPWYFSLLHGAIWGSLVGFGIWKASKGTRPAWP